MTDFLNWFIKHWAELAAALGLGGGSGLLAKKMTDKKQDKKISDLEKKVNSLNEDMLQLKNDIKTNTMFDKQFREQVEKEYNGIKEGMREIKEGLQLLTNHLLNKK